MFNKTVDAFARVRSGFIIAAAATAIGVPLAFASLSGVRLDEIATGFDLTNFYEDIGAILVAILIVEVVAWVVSVGTHSHKHLVK